MKVRVRIAQDSLINRTGRESVGVVHPAAVATAMAIASATPAHGTYVPAPPQYRVVVDNPQNAGGVDPASGQPYPAVGQYADPASNTVHTTRGYSRRLVAQDVGQLVGYNVLNAGDRAFFSRLLKTGAWDGKQGAKVGQRQAGSEAFANYYAVAATGGLRPGESLAWGETPIDPKTLKKYTAALQRLGRRRGLRPYTP